MESYSAKDISNYIICRKRDENILTVHERIDSIKEIPVNKELLKYLKLLLNRLTISIKPQYDEISIEDKIIKLMLNGRLEGYCWQTTESAIIFLSDIAHIERGYLRFDKFKWYFHSWIVVSYDNTEYVFDPSLNILTSKKEYYDKFEVDLRAVINGEDVISELLDKISKNDKESSKEVIIIGNDDINSPMFRNNAGYIAKIEDEKIQKLTAYFY